MSLLRADAIALPLRDESVDLVVTSPPYFAQRSYRDGGEHYSGQIGSEPSPQAFLEALWAVMAECWRVLKPEGSVWVNLGDKRAGSGGSNQSGISSKSTLTGGREKLDDRRFGGPVATRRNAPDRYIQQCFGRPKSKQLLPHRFAIGCEDGMADPDGIGWVMRQDQVWWKPNGLPESVKDRTADKHEYWFHLTKSERYFADIDPIREPHTSIEEVGARRGPSGMNRGTAVGRTHDDGGGVRGFAHTPLGKVPPSVWNIATEPLMVPDHIDVDHFAAFPSEWPRRIILGWSPPGGVVLDPFGGTGTTAAVANALGRYGVHTDLSADYLRLARWRLSDPALRSKVRERTNAAAQVSLFGGAA